MESGVRSVDGVCMLAAMINRDCGREELKPLASKVLADVL
jgi:hypothetical protein